MNGVAKWLIRLACLGFLLTALCDGSAWGAARPPGRSGPVVLHPRFHRTRILAGLVVSDGRYVYLAGLSVAQSSFLIDDLSGRRTSLSRNCGAAVLGGPWLLSGCGLYRLSTGTWQPVPPLVDPCATPDEAGCISGQVAVGADWIEYEETCDHCHDEWFFQNIWTGQQESLPDWQPGGTTFPDLNSSTLAGTLCPPLRVPVSYAENRFEDPEPGWLTFDGPFAIATRNDHWHPTGFVERCGSALHKRIEPPPQTSWGPEPKLAADSHIVMWQATSRELRGLFLPSLRPVTIILPGFLDASPQIAVGPRTLYVEDGSGQIWTAPSPALPRRSHRKHRK